MNWIENLIWGEGVAHSIMLFAFVIATGIILGKIKIKGISLGITFVLFVGIFAGHFGLKLNHEVLHFMKEFGLILFVYSVGLQVGPGFFSSFRKGGLQLNILAASIVFLGAITTIILHYATDIPMPTMVGIMSGAVTNTPGLGAAQEAYSDIHGIGEPTIAMGYAVAYPLAVVGIISTIILMRYIFRINMKSETEKLQDSSVSQSTVKLLSLEVKNPAIFGKTIKDVTPLLDNKKFIVSRILHSKNEHIEIASSKTILDEGDKILVVTTPSDEPIITTFVGGAIEMSSDNWAVLDKQLVAKRVLVTRSAINGKTIKELNLRNNFGVNITRVNRSGVDLVAYPNLQLQIGDRLMIVGDANAIHNVSKTLGNQLKMLNEPHLIPIFIGIFLGVLLGSIPFAFPGIPQPVKLGLAGGPLIVAILMSILGVRYKLVTYTTLSANLMLREIGICFFLACVGLGAGENFIETILHGGGIGWIGYGIIITLIPLFIVGLIARKVFKLNYYTLIGMTAGSMTDPPALAYANSISPDNDAPAIGYASVYPFTMFLRVLVAQLLILFFL
ncbi:putative transporter [Dysgonomonas sp. Marseille-P4677]|uniref:putative transporter n=1 Tax=Dysgonomonas sp. Marseille-P4677 TaxID=2364790 RepID=UPI001911E79E|nr:putative transporter [Dysgonomonas sp. Marseille-P4677]MBK5722934.1 putative transporter [Dysgonomonas sp. Marseille-P4677]